MKLRTLLCVGLLITLSACTGMAVKNEQSSNKEQPFKHIKKNPLISEDSYLINGKGDQHTKRLMAWINISKD